MKIIILMLPMILPIIGALALSTKKIINEKRMKLFVMLIVILNFLASIAAGFYSKNELVHILKVNEFLDIYFHIDNLGLLFSVMAGLLWTLTAIYSFKYMEHEKRNRMFYVFFILTLGVVQGVSYSANLFTLYIYYEILTLSTFPLVIHAGTEEALQSGKKYIIYSFMGATFIILGMMMLYSVSGDMSFIGGGIVSLMSHPDRYMVLISYLSMFIGFGVKSAMVPFHSWLPSAMVAPTPVSALLHAVAVVKSGIFSLMRITYFLYGPVLVKAMRADKYLIPVVIITIIMGSMLALHQDHLKKRLAYSTIAQLGYIVLGILILNPRGFTGAILHMVNHAFIKITMFFIVGVIAFTTKKKYIHEIKGLGKKMPKTFIIYTISAISLVGIPPTNGFVSKWFLGLGALGAGKTMFVIILLLSAFLTAGYLFPVVTTAFYTKSEDKDEVIISVDKQMMIPLFILTGIIVYLGLFPNLLINFIDIIVSGVF